MRIDDINFFLNIWSKFLIETFRKIHHFSTTQKKTAGLITNRTPKTGTKSKNHNKGLALGLKIGLSFSNNR
jgi:hypothetical protein